MSHLVLARKYRPQSFAQVVGQDVIVKTLSAALAKGRIAHAMLFTGSRGVGKTSIARLVAKALVCSNPQGPEPCGTCSQCDAIDRFSSLDVVEIDGASHTGVDDIRDLRDSARYQPTSAKYKIFIIDEVHMLSINAFNALLKILEEPPPHVIFIFATTEAHKIPKTILSRCQRYDFKRIGIDVIFGALKDVVNRENLKFDDDGLMLIAELADGGMRDGLSMCEQVLSAHAPHNDAELVAKILGVVSHQAIKAVSLAIIEQKIEPALKIVKDVYESGLDLCQMTDALSERFRLLSLCAHLASFAQAKQIIPALSEPDFLAAKTYEKGDLKRLFAMTLDALGQVSAAPKPLYALELFVLRAALRPPIAEASTISFHLQKLDAILHNRPMPAEPVLPVAEKKIPTSSPPKNMTEAFERLVEILNKSVPPLASHLRHARPQMNPDGQSIDLQFDLDLHCQEVQMHRHHEDLQAGLEEIFGRSYELNFIVDKQPEEAVRQIKTVAQTEIAKKEQAHFDLLELAKNDELVKNALEIFGGDIAEVKRIATHTVNG